MATCLICERTKPQNYRGPIRGSKDPCPDHGAISLPPASWPTGSIISSAPAPVETRSLAPPDQTTFKIAAELRLTDYKAPAWTLEGKCKRHPVTPRVDICPECQAVSKQAKPAAA